MLGKVFNKAKELSSKGLEKGRDFAEKKIHEAQRKNAVEVLNKTQNKVSGKNKDVLDKARVLVATKFNDGGGIPNNYEAKSPKDIWNMWTMLQKRHFIQDHIHSGDMTAPQEVKDNWRMYTNFEYDKLHPYIQDELQRHLWQGQYAKGGGIGTWTYEIGGL